MAVKLDKSKFVKNLAKKYKLVPHLDKAIGQGEFEWHFDHTGKKRDDAWHPSGDCIGTPRELYDKATGAVEERSFGPGMLKTFMVGHFWHQYLQWVTCEVLGFCKRDSIERRGKKVWGRQRFSVSSALDGPPKAYQWATGSADISQCTIPHHGTYLIDFKTMGEHDYKQQNLPVWAAKKYEAQLNVYMDWFGANKALIVAINKNTPHDFKEFEFQYHPDIAEAIFKKWELVGECIEEGIEPPENEDIVIPFRGPV